MACGVWLPKVIVSPDNKSPIPAIESIDSGITGETISISGNGSSDPEDDVLSYAWSEVTGANVVFSDPSAFYTDMQFPDVDEDTTITIRLCVNDGNNDTACTDKDIIIIANQPPVAVIAGVTDGDMGSSGVANGSGSSDADGDALTYSWSEVTNTGITFDSANTVSTGYTLPEVTEDTTATIQLCVNDGVNPEICTTTDIVIKFVSCSEAEKVTQPANQMLASVDFDLADYTGINATNNLNPISQIDGTTNQVVQHIDPWVTYTGGVYYMHPDGRMGNPLSPGSTTVVSPAGAGHVWLRGEETTNYLGQRSSKYDTFGQVLSSPLAAGTTYRFAAYVGGGTASSQDYPVLAASKVSLIGLPTARPDAYLNVVGQRVTEVDSTAIDLGSAEAGVTGTDWRLIYIDFTPAVDIHTLMITLDPVPNTHTSDGSSVGIDRIMLGELSDFACSN